MTLPNFSFEKRLWKRRYKFVAGLDEVGRGCFAGPVVASAVSFAMMADSQWLIVKKDLKALNIRIDDSKKLTRKRRGLADSWIRENAVTWGVGEASVAEINRLGIVKATNIAFRRAIGSANRRLHFRIQYLLIDAFYIPYTRDYPIGGYLPENSRQMAIVNGDEKSLSIAAASIVAKVYRDLLMDQTTIHFTRPLAPGSYIVQIRSDNLFNSALFMVTGK